MEISFFLVHYNAKKMHAFQDLQPSSHMVAGAATAALLGPVGVLAYFGYMAVSNTDADNCSVWKQGVEYGVGYWGVYFAMNYLFVKR